MCAFEIEQQQLIDSFHYFSTSMMHWNFQRASAFAMGQRQNFSASDVQKLNIQYKCYAYQKEALEEEAIQDA